MEFGNRSRLLSALTLLFVSAVKLHAEDFVVENGKARLVIRPDAVVASLSDKRMSRELLSPALQPLAAIRKGDQVYPATSAAMSGDVLTLAFGASGATAEYRLTASAGYLLLELIAFHGTAIDEIRLAQFDVALANAGSPLSVRWDPESVVCLMGLSDHVETKSAGRTTRASVYPGLSTPGNAEGTVIGERVAIIVGPTSGFLDQVLQVERDFNLPSPFIEGKWAKRSTDVRTSYLFTDLTERNVDETIRYAKQGGFRYILIYGTTWSVSLGSYLIDQRNYPGGEAGLKAVIDKCHAAGLKVGMHMLTSFIGKNDPLVSPKPSPWLLKDGEATLAADLSVSDTTLTTNSTPAGFPVDGNAPYGPAREVIVDEEIIRYQRIDGTRFVRCVRGFAGTAVSVHRAGAKIRHLVEYDGAYIADLKTPLLDSISERISGLINRCGFDMIYFDGGEINVLNGPGWYWVGVQQMRIWQKSKRPLLVQGSGITAWTWHIFARGTSDDFSSVDVREYLDLHKIADSWMGYARDFLPAELGWTGFLTAAPDHRATTPDEVEHQAVRMLALDSPVSLETSLDDLKANGRTEEMLNLLRRYEQLRLSGTVPESTRRKLKTGEWHMTSPGEFHPIRYETRRLQLPGEIQVRSELPQPLRFRLEAVPTLAPLGDPANIVILSAPQAFSLPASIANRDMPGALIRHVEFPGPIDLTRHRALSVQIEAPESAPGPGSVPVLNVQLVAAGSGYRDYYIDLDFRGARTVTLAEPGFGRMLAEFRPAPANYSFKTALRSFDYKNVVAINFRWMRYPVAAVAPFRVGQVQALEERAGLISGLEISVGSQRIRLPAPLKTGEYAEYWGDGSLRVFDRNGNPLSTLTVGAGPQLMLGDSKVTVTASDPGSISFTAITLGK